MSLARILMLSSALDPVTGAEAPPEVCGEGHREAPSRPLPPRADRRCETTPLSPAEVEDAHRRGVVASS